MATCFIQFPKGKLAVAPHTAREMVEKQLIVSSDTVGIFTATVDMNSVFEFLKGNREVSSDPASVRFPRKRIS